MKRRILLAVTGLSPQVVTETLYALTREGWVPDEVHVLTTAEGKRRAELALLSDDRGWFHRLRRDFRLPPIGFDADHIHCIMGGDGQPLEDIRTPEDNERAADALTEQVRRWTADANTQLHVSIAGGRKTMGYYLGYALSLFGRAHDRLSHVLVDEPFESSWEFFYPTPYSRVIETRDHSLADTRDAVVTLAEIPFVTLREGLPERLLQGRTSFTDTVAAARRLLDPPELIIDLDSQCLRAGGEIVRLSPADLAFYAMMARRAANGEPPLDHREESLARRYLDAYASLVGRQKQGRL